MPVEPFRIDDIPVGDLARIGLCRLPGRSGDLAADLDEIARWAPAIVVSMTETDEMNEKGAAGLLSTLARAGIAHAHFPIRDFGTPEPVDLRWPALAERLHAVLDANGRVLLHCLGGKGRSGMVALRLLIERGCAPGEALKMVRDARPGAVETEAQALWGKSGRRREA